MRMIPRETRIAVREMGDGSQRFQPEWKALFFWYQFGDIEPSPIDALTPFLAFYISDLKFDRKSLNERGFSTLKKAQDFIDSYIEQFNERVAEANASKIKSTTYVKYP